MRTWNNAVRIVRAVDGDLAELQWVLDAAVGSKRRRVIRLLAYRLVFNRVPLLRENTRLLDALERERECVGRLRQSVAAWQIRAEEAEAGVVRVQAHLDAVLSGLQRFRGYWWIENLLREFSASLARDQTTTFRKPR